MSTPTCLRWLHVVTGLLLCAPLLGQAQEKHPIPYVPAPWEGVCFVTTPALNAGLRKIGFPPVLTHQCAISTHEGRFYISVTVNAFNLDASPLLQVDYFAAAEMPPPMLRFPDGQTLTAPRPPQHTGWSAVWMSRGWEGDDAIRVMQHLMQAPSVQVQYWVDAQLAPVRKETVGAHTATVALAGLPTAWKRLFDAVAALPRLPID